MWLLLGRTAFQLVLLTICLKIHGSIFSSVRSHLEVAEIVLFLSSWPVSSRLGPNDWCLKLVILFWSHWLLQPHSDKKEISSKAQDWRANRVSSAEVLTVCSSTEFRRSSCLLVSLNSHCALFIPLKSLTLSADKVDSIHFAQSSSFALSWTMWVCTM